MHNTKILCTIGPASEKSETIKQMFEAGMNAARINTSHGTLEEYTEKIKKIRKIVNIPILFDTSGPQIRLVSKKEILLEKGAQVNAGFSAKKNLYFSRNFFNEIKTGSSVFLSDGLAELVVVKKDNKLKEITLKSLNQITLKGNMHSNIPSIYLDIPILSPRDKKVIALAKKTGIDFINLSFTRRKSDIIAVKKLLKGSNVGIIAKIENWEGVKKIDEILSEADGIMVARGDLGMEIPMEKVPIVQKAIVKKCNQAGKISIIATQMLASMVKNPLPTRAETSDVANAILDGADCVMLSNETAIGEFPVEAVKVIGKIASETEQAVKSTIDSKMLSGVSDTISKSIHNISKNIKVDKIVAVTRSGFTARMISRFKPKQKVIAVTDNPAVARKLWLSYGVIPVLIKKIPKQHRIPLIAKILAKKGILKKTEIAVFTAGYYSKKEYSSNMIVVVKAGDLLK
ncbi:MAG: pyruvate kinase [Candidatus Diapherotrites archaeon]